MLTTSKGLRDWHILHRAAEINLAGRLRNAMKGGKTEKETEQNIGCSRDGNRYRFDHDWVLSTPSENLVWRYA